MICNNNAGIHVDHSQKLIISYITPANCMSICSIVFACVCDTPTTHTHTHTHIYTHTHTQTHTHTYTRTKEDHQIIYFEDNKENMYMYTFPPMTLDKCAFQERKSMCSYLPCAASSERVKEHLGLSERKKRKYWLLLHDYLINCTRQWYTDEWKYFMRTFTSRQPQSSAQVVVAEILTNVLDCQAGIKPKTPGSDGQRIRPISLSVGLLYSFPIKALM